MDAGAAPSRVARKPDTAGQLCSVRSFAGSTQIPASPGRGGRRGGTPRDGSVMERGSSARRTMGRSVILGSIDLFGSGGGARSRGVRR